MSSKCCSLGGLSWPYLALILATAALNLQTVCSTDLLFVGTTDFLEANPPKRISSATLTASLASLLSIPAPNPVDKASSGEINQLISPDFLHRPAAVWVLEVDGVSGEDSEAFKGIKAWKDSVGRVQTGPVELEEGGAGRVVSELVAVVEAVGDGVRAGKLQGDSLRGCGDACLEMRLKEVVGAVGMLYKAGEKPLTGVIVKGSGEDEVDLRLGEKAVRAWVRELVEVWGQMSRMMTNEGPTTVFWYTTLAGLQLVRAVHAPDSKEFGVAVEMTWALMGRVHEMLENISIGEVVAQISFVGDVDLLPVRNEFAMSFNGQAQRLLEIGAEKTTAVDQTAAKNSFNTKAAAFGVTIFIFFFLLGGLYTMVNMDFTSDTFLYSQSKVD